MRNTSFSLKAFLTVIILSTVFNVYAQDHIKMTSNFDAKNIELFNLMDFQNIDYYQSNFTGNIKNKHVAIISKEVWNGEITKIDTVINTVSVGKYGLMQTDTLAVTAIASIVNGNKLKVYFRFPNFATRKEYDAITSDDYSLRAVGSELKITSGTAFPAYVFILPYEKGNAKYYCAVDQSGVKVEEWGKKFNLKHYVIFEMKFI